MRKIKVENYLEILCTKINKTGTRQKPNDEDYEKTAIVPHLAAGGYKIKWWDDCYWQKKPTPTVWGNSLRLKWQIM